MIKRGTSWPAGDLPGSSSSRRIKPSKFKEWFCGDSPILQTCSVCNSFKWSCFEVLKPSIAFKPHEVIHVVASTSQYVIILIHVHAFTHDTHCQLIPSTSYSSDGTDLYEHSLQLKLKLQLASRFESSFKSCVPNLFHCGHKDKLHLVLHTDTNRHR